MVLHRPSQHLQEASFCRDRLEGIITLEPVSGILDPDPHSKESHLLDLCDTGWWFGTFFIFPYIGNVIIPVDEVIFFR